MEIDWYDTFAVIINNWIKNGALISIQLYLMLIIWSTSSIIYTEPKDMFYNNQWWIFLDMCVLMHKISSLNILLCEACMLIACQYQMKHIYLYSFLFFIVLQSLYNNLVWFLSSVCGNHHNIISFPVCVKNVQNFIATF